MNKPNVGTLLDSLASGDIEKVRACLSHGVPAGGSKNFLNTPLHYAAHDGRVDFIRLLVESGAKVDVVNDRGRTPLHTAAARGKIEAVAEFVRLGADMLALDSAGLTPRDLACESTGTDAPGVVAFFDAAQAHDLLRQTIAKVHDAARASMA